MASVSDVDFDPVEDAGGAVTRQVTVTVASGDDYAVALFSMSATGGASISSITFNGSGMTQIPNSPYTSGDGDWEFYGYYYDVSGLGAGNYECQVTLSGVPNDAVLMCAILANADTPTNWTEDTDTGTMIDIAVSSAASGVTLWMVLQDVDTTLTPSGGETEVFDGQFSGASAWYYCSGYYKASTGSTTTSNIALDSATWRGVGVFVPNAGGAAALSIAAIIQNYRNMMQ